MFNWRKNAYMVLFLLTAPIVLLAGCGGRQAATGHWQGGQGPPPSDPFIKAELSNSVDGEVSALYTAFSEPFDGGYAADVVFATTAGNVYQADIYVARTKDRHWFIPGADYVKVSHDKPVSNMEFGTETADKQKVSIVSGLVSDRRIAYVTVGFSDGASIRLQPEPLFHTYTFASGGPYVPVREVSGYAQDGRLIYRHVLKRYR